MDAISYSYADDAHARLDQLNKYTESTNAPTDPKLGDEWYNLTNNTIYKYVSDLISDHWVAVSTSDSPTVKLVTTERLLIQDDKAVLPSKALGDILLNTAVLFDNTEDMLITMEVTCTTDGDNVIFDTIDMVNGKFCKVSYLSGVDI